MSDVQEVVALHLKAHPWLSAEPGSIWVISGKGRTVTHSGRHVPCAFEEALFEFVGGDGDDAPFMRLSTTAGWGYIGFDGIQHAHEMRLVRVEAD